MAEGVFKPEKLPPTTGAAIQHSLRAYLQYRDWLMLESQLMNPGEYGWIFTDYSRVHFLQLPDHCNRKLLRE